MGKKKRFTVSPSAFRRIAIRTLSAKGVAVSHTTVRNTELIVLLREHTDLVFPANMSKKQAYEVLTNQIMDRKPSLAKLAGVRQVVDRNSPSEKQIVAFYASWDWKRLSYDVKLERGRTCECCGAKAPKAVIHTDHVKPIRHFWHLRLDRANLQILCEDCNMGKGSRDNTDFRALNTEQDVEPEPELSEADLRLLAIREQLRLN